MRNNLGTPDKVIRIAATLLIFALVFTKTITGVLSIASFIISIILLSTVFNSNCPVYRFFGINTNKNLNDKARASERNQTLLNNYMRNYHEKTGRHTKKIVENNR